MTKTKFEAMDILNKYDIPCGPILSMKEIAEDEALHPTGTLVEVDHPTRGKYLTVGNPIKLSASPPRCVRSPLLGEHTQEILRDVLGFSDEIREIEGSGARRRAIASQHRARRAPEGRSRPTRGAPREQPAAMPAAQRDGRSPALRTTGNSPRTRRSIVMATQH